MRYLVLCLLALGLTGCEELDRLLLPSSGTASRLVDLAEVRVEDREGNYAGGSCVHASLVTAMRYQGKPELADWWRRTHSGGEFPHRTNRKLRDAGIPSAYTLRENNVAFLQWAVDNRLGCGVAINGGRHMILLVEMTKTHVCLIDNNNVRRLYWLPRDRFIQNWTDAGSWGVTPVLRRVPQPPNRSKI